MFDWKPYVLLLWKRRWFLLVNLILVMAVAVAVAFFIVQKEYASQATFLPPISGSGSMLAMSANPLLGMLSGDESGDNVEAIFDSKALKRRVIDEFNLYDNYQLNDNPNKFEMAVKQMGKQVMLTSTLKGKGIGMSKTVSYSIVCFHTSPDTALLMAEFIFACLDSAMIDISINKANRNREFIESQFVASQEKLDSLQNEFKEFQVEHKAFNVHEQMKLTLQIYAEIKSAAVMNDMRLAILQQSLRGSSPEITEARNTKRVYERQLAEFEQNTNYAVLPSLNVSSELMPKFTNIYRALEVQNQINLLLSRELEQARLQEARDVSPLILIDPPYVAEYKARPKRIPMVVIIVGAYMFFLTFFILTYKLFLDFYRVNFRTPKPER